MSDEKKREFEMHVKSNMKRAYFCALGFTGSHDEAMDLSQQAFIKAYKAFPSFDGRCMFFTWYYKILRNLCINFARNKKSRRRSAFIELDDSIPSEDNTADIIEKEELLNLTEKALLKLRASDREIIILREFQGLGYKEISELLEIPVGTVMSKLFYARKRLADLVEGEK